MRELILVSCANARYGIWKDAIQSIRGIGELHRIPLSPAHIAGIMLDGDRTVTVLDLSVCLGYERSREFTTGNLLLIEQGDGLTGFAVDDVADQVSVSTGSLLPLPPVLESRIVEACAVRDGCPVPVIDIVSLIDLVRQGGAQVATSIRNDGLKVRDASGSTRIRYFSVGGESYALPADGIDAGISAPDCVASLPGQPEHIPGVTLHEGGLIPVIDMERLICRSAGRSGKMMLVADIGGSKCGLLVERDEGALSAYKAAIRPAPPVVRTSWMRHMVIHAGKILPLIDLTATLAVEVGMTASSGQGYQPDTGFLDDYLKRDVDVVEFSLLGERHALPKTEVQDVVACKPYRALRDTPQVVVGVAIHEGQILPVIDLAMMFGRHALATSGWRMMVVGNGDFRALVITEQVFGERRLALEMQRKVPLHLPHTLMYGCYPDAGAVRLVLDIEAIAVHFERTLVQQFLPALSDGMKMKSVAVELQPEVRPEPVEQEIIEPEIVEQEVIAPETVEPEIVEPEVANEEPAVDLPANQSHEDAVVADSHAFEVGQTAPERESAIQLSAEEEAVATERANIRQPEPVQIEVQDEESLAPVMEASAELEDAVPDMPSESLNAEEDRRSGSFIMSLRREWSSYSYTELALFLLMAAGLAAVKYHAGMDETPRTLLPIAQGKIATSPEQPANSDKPVQVDESVRTDKPVAPLELDVAANVPVENEIYVVREGDTLWSISERFTGDPFNYPRIAGENRLADPDLIFPGQRIRLLKSK